jgi:hypothetical protein
MKIIISRKGFDSTYGGVHSPVFEDSNRFISLPIQSENESYEDNEYNQIKYNDLSLYGHNFGKLVSDLTSRKKKKITGEDSVHFDPDLVRDTYKIMRDENWKPLFGQVGISQLHLNNQKATKGDIFLFFGLYCWVEKVDGKYQYVRGKKPFHMLWGWMQIGDIIHLDDEKDKDKIKPWMKYHSHFHFLNKPEANASTKPKRGVDSYTANTLYVASDDLIISDKLILKGGGAGVFSKYHKELQLTKEDSNRLTEWILPACFYNEDPTKQLTYHQKREGCELNKDECHLTAACIGQEFVLNCDENPGVEEWVKSLFFEETGNK